MTTSDSRVALDQHFARALSSRSSSSPPHDTGYPKSMEPFGSGSQAQRYCGNRSRVNVLKRRTPTCPDLVPALLPKRQRFGFPQPPTFPSSQQYAMTPPGYYTNSGMVPPMVPVSPNSCMMPAVSPNGYMVPLTSPVPPHMTLNSCMVPPTMTPPPFLQHPGPGWYSNPPEHHPTPRCGTGGGIVYPEFAQYLFHPEVDSFKDIPRLPGETFGNEEAFPDDRNPMLLPHFTEKWGEPVNTQTSKESFMSPPSSKAAAVVDRIRMTDEEMDGILELKGEI